MRIEDSLLFYEENEYIINIDCLFYRFGKTNEVLSYEVRSICSLSDVNEVVKNSLKDFGEEYSLDYLSKISYRVYLPSVEKKYRRKAIKYKIVKTKVASKYKKESYEIEKKKMVYCGDLNWNVF